MKLLSQDKINKINVLIPDAVAKANEEVGDVNRNDIYKCNEWNQIFHTEMDRLTIENDLRY